VKTWSALAEATRRTVLGAAATTPEVDQREHRLHHHVSNLAPWSGKALSHSPLSSRARRDGRGVYEAFDEEATAAAFAFE